MTSRLVFLKLALLPIVFLLISCQTLPAPDEMGDARCNGIAERGYLNVLTLNLLFSEVRNRNQRLEAIADFAADQEVDVLLLQEVVNGVLVDTENSAQDLRDILRTKHNVDYNIRTAFEIGLPGLLSVANAVLSRCEIQFSLTQRLPKASELEFDGRVIRLPRNVLLTRLEIPEFGIINVYNTHLCARCDLEEHADQVDELLKFVNTLEVNIQGDHPNVLGGDFNIDRFKNGGEERFLYEKITDAGFIDAYAVAVGDSLDELCQEERNADRHCTVGVSDLNGDNARRIDYIFTRGFGEVRQSAVVFNPNAPNGVPPTVSDHAAVVTRLSLP